MKPLIIIATDHAGLGLRDFVGEYVKGRGYECLDLSPANGERVDYPDYARALCEAMGERIESNKPCFGILICGSGIGMSIAANRHRHIRAALCTDAYMAKMARAHNDANVLCMGERISGVGEVESILEAFFETAFEGGRHFARVQKLS